MRRKLTLTMFTMGMVCALGTPTMAQPFPGIGKDTFESKAAFKVQLLDGTQITIAELADTGTVVGRSDPHAEGALADLIGTPIDMGGGGAYPNTSAIAADPIRRPVGWPENDLNRREVHVEILSMNLAGAGGAVQAGQPAFDTLNGLGLGAIYKNSFGEVASQDPNGVVPNDFPADSFFNIFPVVQAGGNTFATLHPMVVQRQAPLTGFPPTFELPEGDYIHDPNFPAILLYSTDSGLPVGHLTSAGHGSGVLAGGPEAPIIYRAPISFGVDNGSAGLILAQSPVNDVRADAGLPEQQVTVYESGVPFNNNRNPSLIGVVGPQPGEFQVGDTLNSMSSGRDGTRSSETGELKPGVLHFSVDRTSVGADGTDVNLDSTAGVPKQAAGIYVTGVGEFGAYNSTLLGSVPMSNNFLAVDPTMIGLRPSLFDLFQDNVTSLELSSFNPGDLHYGTYLPFFGSPGDEASIWIFDTNLQPYQDGNLNPVPFSTPAQLGLQDGDIIDALVLSDTGDVGVGISAEANLDEVLFSLAPGSPSLLGADGDFGIAGIDDDGINGIDDPGEYGFLGSDDFSSADVFYSDFDTTFRIFADHIKLGLLFGDNIDALDISSTINGPNGFTPEPSTFILAILGLLTLCLTGRRGSRLRSR